MISRISALLLLGLLGACASSEASRSKGAPTDSSATTAESDEGSVAAGVGKGALVGAATPLYIAGEACQQGGSGCGLALAFGVVLAPVGAVIGAGVGLVAGLADDGPDQTAAVSTGGSSASAVPDRRVAGWIDECRKVQGPIPSAVIVPDGASEEDAQPNPEFYAWFEGCEAVLEPKWDAIARARVPAKCRNDPPPTTLRVTCQQSTAEGEQERRRARALLHTERLKLQIRSPLES